MNSLEFNFDGIVGPTHNYAGLSLGNRASMAHKGIVSNPKAAALEGLRKMRFISGLGVCQCVIPPHQRPSILDLRAHGFHGSDLDVVKSAFREVPTLLASCCSASSMWAANAATVSPSFDTRDRKVHITPANLSSNQHRKIETQFTGQIFKKIFPSISFNHHRPVQSEFGDEGAAAGGK